MGKIKFKLPEIKRQIVSPITKAFVRFRDSKGKKQKAKVKEWAEKDIDDTHLIKIAPMYYFSLDSNTVLMIPFSIKFTPEQFAKQTASQAVNFKDIMEEVEAIQKEAQNQK